VDDVLPTEGEDSTANVPIVESPVEISNDGTVQEMSINGGVVDDAEGITSDESPATKDEEAHDVVDVLESSNVVHGGDKVVSVVGANKDVDIAPIADDASNEDDNSVEPLPEIATINTPDEDVDLAVKETSAHDDDANAQSADGNGEAIASNTQDLTI